jgi:hypothetical protein
MFPDWFGLGVGAFACFATAAFFCWLFWVWMLVEAAVKEPSEGHEKVIWVLLILFLPFLGSLVYFFVRRPRRIELIGE